MGPIMMTVAIVAAFGLFGWSANKRWRLLKIGAPENRFDRMGERIRAALKIALLQKKLPKYAIMGPIHMAIFWGFLVLLLNTLILWGRGYDENFNLFILGDNILGDIFRFVKDIASALVLVASFFALINRVVLRPERLTKSVEATVILLIIFVMMLADLAYWGSDLLAQGVDGFHASEPFASLAAGLFATMDANAVNAIGVVGFWVHSLLVLIFLNLLPYGKHFHVITSIPNVFFSNLNPPGRLPRDENIEKVLREEEEEDEDEEPVFGVAEVQHFTWKDLLDLYSCTECGRCTDNCPAAKTGKPLKPKQFLCDIRNHLYERQGEFLSGKAESKALIPDVIDPEVVWSCTTCRACEEECPVMNTYVDKMVRLRRELVEGRGDVPAELATALRGMETNSNPWNLSAMDRDGWTEGLEVEVTPFDGEECEYLFYVGCNASFDDRAKKITRALVKLFDQAGVSYGYLGGEEPCCGETARRGGSESNFRMMVDMNIEVFNEMGVKKIVTACPHCFNTLKNEYPEFGGNYEVVHHTELLAQLLRQGKLSPKEAIDQKVVYHDGCYLGRYNDVYSPPREILKRIPGLQAVEVPTSKERGLCCGAGGARFFMEESGERVNNRRIEELLAHDPKSVATACPYCMTMLSDGLKDKDLFDDKGQLDVAELLAISCGVGEPKLLKNS